MGMRVKEKGARSIYRREKGAGIHKRRGKRKKVPSQLLAGDRCKRKTL